MSFLNKILSKLGIGSANAASPQSAEAPSATPAGTAGTVPASAGATPAAPATQAAPVDVVDVVAQLEKRAAADTQKLNWRTSIVDLLKLLDLDSSFAARKELATELGCPPELMEDSAQMNMWLHKNVLARIAANGGNVPQELLS